MTYFPKFGNQGADAPPIVWLASYPKSGNTWVRLFLNAYFSDQPVDINGLDVTVGDLNKYLFQNVAPCPLPEMTQQQYVLCRPAMLTHLVQFYVVRPLLVKTHNANCLAEGVPMIPECMTHKALYIVRDPRDVCVSLAHHMKVDYETAAGHLEDNTYAVGDHPLLHFVWSWSHHVKSWLTEQKFPVALVRYEDLLDTPFEKFKGILEFLEVPDIDDERVRRAIEATQFERLAAQERSNGFDEAPHDGPFFREGTANQWRTELSESTVAHIQNSHWEMMTQVGYELSTKMADVS